MPLDFVGKKRASEKSQNNFKAKSNEFESVWQLTKVLNYQDFSSLRAGCRNHGAWRRAAELLAVADKIGRRRYRDGLCRPGNARATRCKDSI
jgi:CRISPR/Cas system CMR-associated protein Cmr1 (group 7 of RAMP superfamily)